MYRAWVAMRSMFNFAHDEGFVTNRPDHAIPRPKAAKPDIRPFTKIELRQIADSTIRTAPASTERRTIFTMRRATGLRDRAIVLTLIDTGMRARELVRLKHGDFNQAVGELHIRPFETGKTTPRTLPLGGNAQQALWKYLAGRSGQLYSDSPLFAPRRREMTYNGLRQMLTHLGKRAKVPGVHAHRFRHSFAYWYLMNGGDGFSLQRLLGHASFKVFHVSFVGAGPGGGPALDDLGR